MSNNEDVLFLVVKSTGRNSYRRTLGTWVFRTREAARAYAKTHNKKARKSFKGVVYVVRQAKWGPEQ